MEVADEGSGEVLDATGQGPWRVQELYGLIGQ